MADGDYMRVLKHYQSVFDKMFGLTVVSETITGVTTLVQGAKTFTGGGAGVAGGEGASGIGALASILGVKG